MNINTESSIFPYFHSFVLNSQHLEPFSISLEGLNYLELILVCCEASLKVTLVNYILIVQNLIEFGRVYLKDNFSETRND